MHPYLAVYRREIRVALRPAQAARLDAIDASTTEEKDDRELARVGADHALRRALPLLLEGVGLRREASQLRDLPAIEDEASARTAERLLGRVRQRAEREVRAVEEPPFPGRRALNAVLLCERIVAPLSADDEDHAAWTEHAGHVASVFVLLLEGFPSELALVEPLAVDVFRDMVDPDMVEAATPQPASSRGVWTYRNRQGRLVFVGGESMVPPEYRESARPLDLSHVSLNEELGTEWDATIAREHRRLAAGSFCASAVEAAEEEPVEVAWREHTHLVGIGAVILALLLASPWIARQVGGALWLRTMIFVVPMLVLLGLLAHVAIETRSALAQTRETADLCDPTRPGDTRERLGVVQQLIGRIRAAEQRRLEAIDAQIEAARE